MAESGVRKFRPPSSGKQRGTNKSQRSASECRKKTSVKADIQRSRSSQSEREKSFQEDENQLPQTAHNQMEKTLLEKSSFPNFFVRVNCPFCLEVQTSKTELVKHLGQNCRAPKTRKTKRFSIFQILPDDSIKCNVCPEERFDSVEGYYRHLYNEDHIFNCSEAARQGKHLTEFFFCSNCYVYIPDNFTQLECHLQHKIHKVRCGSFTCADLRSQGIVSTYGIFGGEKVFRCLACFPQQSLFYAPLEMIKHWKTTQHLRGTKKYSAQKFYCCLCKVELNFHEIPFHFTSDEHGNNDRAAAEGGYELCLYCGFHCGNITDLSHHMRVNCDEIKKIKGEIGPEDNPKEIQDERVGRKRERQKNRCILIKDDANILPLTKILKTFGKIRSLSKYDDEHLVIEYQNESSIENLHLVKNIIFVNNKKVSIKFLQEVQQERDEVA